MTLKEAYSILKEKKFSKKPIKCIEYFSCFVFCFGEEGQMDFMFAINKDDKKAYAFSPLSLPVTEFNKPVKIYNFS